LARHGLRLLLTINFALGSDPKAKLVRGAAFFFGGYWFAQKSSTIRLKSAGPS
jgi:hypothetical protein